MSYSPPEASPAALAAPPLLKLCSIFIWLLLFLPRLLPVLFLLLLCLCFTCPSAVLLGVFLVFFVRLSGIQCNTLGKYFQFQVCLCVVVVSARSLALSLSLFCSISLSLSWGLAYLAYSVAMLALLFLGARRLFPVPAAIGFRLFSSSIFYKFLIIFKYLFCYCLYCWHYVYQNLYSLYLLGMCVRSTLAHTHALCGCCELLLLLLLFLFVVFFFFFFFLFFLLKKRCQKIITYFGICTHTSST